MATSSSVGRTPRTTVPHGLPVGGAAAAALTSRHDPELLHDVAFYESIAAELPDSDALKSMLYTHRHVASTEPTCEEIMKEVDAGVERHVTILRQRQEADAEIAASAERRSVEGEQRTLAARHSQVQSTLDRALATVNDLCLSPQRNAKDHEVRAEKLRQQREQMQRRHHDMLKIVSSNNVEIEDEEVARQRKWREIEEVNARAQALMDEAMARGLCLTDEERARIGISFDMANSRQRVSVLEEHAAGMAALEAACVKEFEWCEVWVQHLHERAKRQQRLRELVASLLKHSEESEASHRSLIVSAEARDRSDIETRRAQPPLTATLRASPSPTSSPKALPLAPPPPVADEPASAADDVAAAPATEASASS